MPEGDAAAVRVHVLRAVLQVRVVHELQRNGRECLVHLDHGDVVPLQARPREGGGAGLRVAVEHAMRIDARETEGDESRARLEVQAAGRLFARDQDGGRTVADLRRVAGGHPSLGQEHGLESGERLRGRVPSRRLVDLEDNAHVRIRQVDRDDLLFEPAVVDRADGASMRLERDRIQLLAREAPLLGDHLGRDPLRHDLPAVEELVRQVAAPRPHRDAGHHLCARRDHEVELSGPDRGRGVEVGLHRRAALAVDGGATHALRPPRDERDHPADVPALLADLRDAAELHVLDLGRIEILPPDECVEDLAGELVGANRGQRAVSLPDRRADVVDDQRVGVPGRHACLD